MIVFNYARTASFRIKSKIVLCVLLGSVVIFNSSCIKSYRPTAGDNNIEIVLSRMFVTDLNTAWQAVLAALKNSTADVANRESGFIQTKWTENTAEKNFTDSFGAADSYLKAQYRFKVNVASTTFDGKPVVKVAVQKEQLIQRDVLEGWRPIETDSIEENTLLYRIGRLISIQMKIAKMEAQKTKKELEESGLQLQ